MTVKELREKAKSLGIRGYSKMVKADLIAAINGAENAMANVGDVPDYALPQGEKLAPKAATKPNGKKRKLGKPSMGPARSKRNVRRNRAERELGHRMSWRMMRKMFGENHD